MWQGPDCRLLSIKYLSYEQSALYLTDFWFSLFPFRLQHFKET